MYDDYTGGTAGSKGWQRGEDAFNVSWTDNARIIDDFLLQPCWKACNLGAGLFFDQANVISTLKIKPELCTGSKPVPQADGCITGYTALGMNDLRYPIGRNIDLPR
jgi:hypothetical protein